MKENALELVFILDKSGSISFNWRHIPREHVSAFCTIIIPANFEDLKIILTYSADYDILFPRE